MADEINGLKLSNHTYDNMKFFVQIVLPALSTLYATLAAIWNLPYVEQVVGTIGAFTVFLGVILRISSSNHKVAAVPEASGRTPVGSFIVTQDIEGKKSVRLSFDQNPEDFIDQQEITFKFETPPVDESRE